MSRTTIPLAHLRVTAAAASAAASSPSPLTSSPSPAPFSSEEDEGEADTPSEEQHTAEEEEEEDSDDEQRNANLSGAAFAAVATHPPPCSSLRASQQQHPRSSDDEEDEVTATASAQRFRARSHSTLVARAAAAAAAAALTNTQQNGLSSFVAAAPASAVTAFTAPPAAHSHRSSRPRVLVTGAAGFIGSHVARALLARGEDIAIVDELNDYYDPRLKVANLTSLLQDYGQRRVHIYVGDICNQELMESVFATEKPDRVIHLAARAGVRPSIADPLLYEQSNVRGTLVLLKLAAAHKIAHFVYASSSSVYGDDTPAPFREDHACNLPVSPYAATKKSCELLASTYAHLHDLPCSGLRFFTVFGENGRRDMAPYIFIDRIARGQSLDMFGDGSSRRDYTFVSDIVQGVVKVMDHPPGKTLDVIAAEAAAAAVPADATVTHPKRLLHEIYNLGVGSPITLRDFISTISTALGRPALIRQLPRQPGDVEATFADISRARTMVGYEPQFSVQEGVKRTVEWYLREVAPRQPETSASSNPEAQAKVAAPSTAVQPTTAVAFPPLSSCLCATRIHNASRTGGSNPGLSPDVLAHLLSWIPRALAAAEFVAIAVDTTDGAMALAQAVETVLRGCLDATQRARVHVVCVSPWNAFCPALNALLAKAVALGCESILYSSLEMAMHPAHCRALARELDASTLVVGARLSGHRFVRGTAVIDGCSTVWNTLALWSCARLARTGFLLVSDGLPEKSQSITTPDGLTIKRVISPAVASGVEEVACVSMQQLLYPDSSQAKLLSMTSPDDVAGSSACSIASVAAASASAAAATAAAIATTSAGDTETSEDAEGEEEDEDEEGVAHHPRLSAGSIHGTRSAEARRAPVASSSSQQLYDDVATPGSNSGVGMMRCTRTVSAPHAVVSATGHSSGLSARKNSSQVAVVAAAAVTPPQQLKKDCAVSSSAASSSCSSSRIPSLHWDADFGGDVLRQAAHDRKMRSKVERAAQQLEHLQLKPGVVQHIHCVLSV